MKRLLITLALAATVGGAAAQGAPCPDNSNLSEVTSSNSPQDMAFHKKMMHRACRLAEKSVKKGGGPFGAVITKDGKIVAESSNSVTLDNDPTAHAEVNTIRKACQNLGTFDLTGCVIYTSAEPCPMCFGAIYWAHLDHIYYGNDKREAANIGFDDDFIYKELEIDPKERRTKMEQLLPEEAIRAFQMWSDKTDKTEY